MLIVAAGRPSMVKRDRIEPGATVVDVGVNRIDLDGRSRLAGDGDPAGPGRCRPHDNRLPSR